MVLDDDTEPHLTLNIALSSGKAGRNFMLCFVASIAIFYLNTDDKVFFGHRTGIFARRQ